MKCNVRFFFLFLAARNSQQLNQNTKYQESPLSVQQDSTSSERKNLSKQTGSSEADLEKGVSDRVQSEKLDSTTASSTTTSTNGFGVYDMCARSRVMVTHFDVNNAVNNENISNPKASNSEVKDKPVYDEPDNREIEDISSNSSLRRSSSTVSRNNSVASSIENCSKVPPKPKYIPASIQDSAGSSTSSYYARVRTRAEVTRRRESGKNEAGSSTTTAADPAFDLPKGEYY